MAWEPAGTAKEIVEFVRGLRIRGLPCGTFLVPAIYECAYDPERPVVCMDEQLVYLMGRRREPLAITAERPQRVDNDCERTDTGAVFLSCEPLSGGWVSTAREQRPKADRAREVVAPPEGRCADYEKISLVDTLHTHTKGAFYEVF